MTLIKSISGFRGTIGGKSGNNLTAADIVACTAAYGSWILETGKAAKVIVGRDGRISGNIVSNLAVNTLLSLGIDVVDLGLSTTPTVEMMVPDLGAGGGIIFTASHNPKQWNALKFLNDKGEFISGDEGKRILELEKEAAAIYADVDELGQYSEKEDAIALHIDKILDLDIIDIETIKRKKYTVVVDCINSTGSISIPPLLDKLGCSYILINDDLSGDFAHNPEPLPAHLSGLSQAIKDNGADLGIAVDPDVDRLAFVCEDGSLFGEEYTLVAVADFILSKTPGNTVSNLSSTRALSDVTLKYGKTYHASAVGEVNVVNKMKEVDAVIGGEGNGGVIYPGLHYGRDALVGIAFVLNLLADKDISLSALRKTYKDYEIRKHKIQLSEGMDLKSIFDSLQDKYAKEQLNLEDGLKIDMENGWVHLRKSNTEPILRVYSESTSAEQADQLAEMIINDVKNLC